MTWIVLPTGCPSTLDSYRSLSGIGALARRPRERTTNMHTIENSALVDSTPATVIQALTTKDGIKGWWTTDCDCNAEAREATFRFEKQAGTVVAVTFRLDGADERSVAMTCVRQINNPGWLGTKLSFAL